MKKTDAKEMIRKIWVTQENKCSTNLLYPLEFYTYIQKHHPDFLTFKFSGDRYQIVKTWVADWQKSFCQHL